MSRAPWSRCKGLCAIGRPLGIVVGGQIAGHLLRLTPCRHHVDILRGRVQIADAVEAIDRAGDAIGLRLVAVRGLRRTRGEGEAAAVGRPNRPAPDALRQVRDLPRLATVHGQDEDLRLTIARRCEGQAPAIGRPLRILVLVLAVG
jgi:hypothetical protein